MKYFAYGSNMSNQEITKWLGNSPNNLGVGTLAGYKFAYNKKGQDGTGKGNVISDSGGVVYGVLYELGPEQMDQLDAKEPSYNRINVSVQLGNEEVQAITYTANPQSIDNSLHPTEEYQNKILKGAKENNLPKDYIEQFLKK